MNTRKYNTNPEVLLEQGKAIMSSTDEARFHFKVFAVNMVLAGCPVSQISTMAGVSKVTVTGWVKAADEQGFAALRSKQRSMVWAIPVSAPSHTPVRAMRIPGIGKRLKKTNRNRERRFLDSCISG